MICFPFYRKGGTDVAEYEKNEIIFQQLTQLLHQMKFGSITLVVQDGRVIQIEKVEKVRLK